jgi:glutaryl-CoA dehydrogenase
MMSVQSSLVMFPIFTYGSEAQRRKYLPKLAAGEWIGCFGLTEPDHGSDPGSMETRAPRAPGGYRVSGAKMWISNSPIADVFVGMGEGRPGHHPRLHPRQGHEGAVGAEDRGQVLAARLGHRRDRDGRVFVPADNLLPNVKGLKGPFGLPQQRALRHRVGRAGRRGILLARGAPVRPRPQAVRRPLAANQLVQKKLADMQTRSRSGCRRACGWAA